ncbi:MAG: hypothetical protein LBS77_00355 [Desulfovibrio sp.]|jgi:hypothetical protein|nr:hypothetical protein [Desulfovibrio sp.]
MRTAFLCFIYALSWLVHGPALTVASSVSGDNGSWTIMPAGARPAYMGIHGGTMPVSLLVVADGSSLLGFVGRTGNDFLDVLRNTKLTFFSSRPASKQLTEADENDISGNLTNLEGKTHVFDGASLGTASVFVTGQGSVRLPVIQINSDLADLPLAMEQLLPFGFSGKPLPVEGHVASPAKSASMRQHRLVFEPQYLQPRRSGAN